MCFIQCDMSAGGFSGEITFEIPLRDGSKHVGLAARRYFWTAEGKAVPKDLKARTPGFVRARILDEEGRDSVLVSIPDGEVVHVNKAQIVRSESAPDVPIRS